MRAFMVFFIFSCSRSARCAIRISLSDTCRAQRSMPSSQSAAIFSWVRGSCTAAICTTVELEITPCLFLILTFPTQCNREKQTYGSRSHF